MALLTPVPKPVAVGVLAGLGVVRLAYLWIRRATLMLTVGVFYLNQD